MSLAEDEESYLGLQGYYMNFVKYFILLLIRISNGKW